MKIKNSLIILLVLFTACNRPTEIGNVPPWPSTGVAAADSLVPKLHAVFDGGMADDVIEPLIDSLSALAAEHPSNKFIDASHSYWKSRLLARQGQIAEANRETMAAMARLDSVRYPYYFNKLRSGLERTTPGVDTRYRTAMENLIYFRSIGDSLSVAHSLITLGNLLRPICEFSKAEAAFRQAGEIWRQAGMERNYFNNQINIALCLDNQRADSLSRELIKSPIIRADTAAYTLLLRNMATAALAEEDHERALALSEEGLAIIGDNDRCAANAAVLNSIKGMENLRQGNLDTALSSARRALMLSDRPIERYAVFYVLETASRIFSACNMKDSAEILLRRAMDVRTDNEYELNNNTLTLEEGRQDLMQLQFNSQLQSMRQQQMWLAVVSALIIISLAGVFIFYRKIRIRRLNEQLALAELKESRSRLARETLMFEQNEQLIDRIKSEIEKNRNSGQISEAVALQLLSTLRIHIADRSERRAFLDVHDNMLPGFASRLKADYPDLTEHQIKLAAYISAGMSNAAIAKLLNITTASVRTLRYRIRSRFGLEHTDSLEDFLRKYSV